MRDRFVFLIHEGRQMVEKLFGADDDLVMVGLEGQRHRARVLQLVRVALGESDGEGFDRLFHKAAHDRRDRARIDAAGEEHSERHISHQVRLDAFVEEFAESLDVLRFIQPLFRLREVNIPVALDLDLAVAPDQRVAGRQSLDTVKERLFARGVTVRRVIGERVVIQLRPDRARLDERLDLRSEVERAVILYGVIQRLDAEPVTRDHEPPAAAVPDRVGEHPAQPLDATRPELLVEADDRFSVRRTAMAWAPWARPRAKLRWAAAPAGEGAPDASVLVGHGLAAPAKIYYGQSSMPKPAGPVYQDPGVARAAMGERIPHRDEPRLVHPDAQ